MNKSQPLHQITTSLAPWLSVVDGEKAVAFYKAAFGAEEFYRLENPGGLVVQLSIAGAPLWIGEDTSMSDTSAKNVGGGTIRMILTVANPEVLFAQALAMGAIEIFPVGEEHGWRLGRLCDPFGLHWELGFPLAH